MYSPRQVAPRLSRKNKEADLNAPAIAVRQRQGIVLDLVRAAAGQGAAEPRRAQRAVLREVSIPSKARAGPRIRVLGMIGPVRRQYVGWVMGSYSNASLPICSFVPTRTPVAVLLSPQRMVRRLPSTQ